MYNEIKKIAYRIAKKIVFRVVKRLSYKFRIIYVKLILIFNRGFRDKKIENINLFEKKYYSQYGEDGILDIIFYKIGTTNKFCLEFGIHPGEGNTIYLKKKGWKCLWMDGNGDNESIKKEFITAENINSIFSKYKVPKEFDLLSIDIDSNDYWIWKSLSDYSPRVVVIEYNASFPPPESKVVKYDPNLTWDGTNYFGASLFAINKLGISKGYTLLACTREGVNAFFVRTDLIKNNFKVKTIQEIYSPPRYGKIVNFRYTGHPQSKKSMISV